MLRKSNYTTNTYEQSRWDDEIEGTISTEQRRYKEKCFSGGSLTPRTIDGKTYYSNR